MARIEAEASFAMCVLRALRKHLDMDQVYVFELGDEGVNVNLTGAGDHASAT